jgi:1-acyl-sn-glycerol-3-phosphate acyltransferase
MSADAALPPKPVTTTVRPEITRLPELTGARRLFRRLLVGFLRLLVKLLLRLEVHGLENVPATGPVLVVSNHLGDADVPIGLTLGKRPVEVYVKADLYDFPLLGPVLRAYGVIWIHRGQPDRRAIRAGLEALQQGRMLAIAPEGRESLSGALEEGTSGAAYLALKSGAPVLPVTFTGTENRRIFGGLHSLQRTRVTAQVGAPFLIEDEGDRRSGVERGTERIMLTLAAQLPPEYRGVYENMEASNGGRSS